MNKIGRNKTLFLKRQGCVFVDDTESWGRETKIYTQIWTKHHEYVGLADLGDKADNVNFIYKHRLTQLSSLRRARGEPLDKHGCNTVSIGFSEKEQKWYGWSHRGYGRFGIGYEVVEGSIMDGGSHKYPFKVETLEQAKELAADIADFLD